MYWLLLTFVAFALADKSTSSDFKTIHHTIRVGEPNVQIFAHSQGGSPKLRTELVASGYDLTLPYQLCEASSDTICIKWSNGANSLTLKITQTAECSHITYNDENPTAELRMNLWFLDAQWYGGPERKLQDWPVQNSVFVEEPYTTREENSQGVLEPYWLSSEGTLYYVYPNTTLFVNTKKENSSPVLELIVANKAPYKPRNSTYITYDVCEAENAVEAHYRAIDRYFGKPVSHPGKRMMTYPTYSTWAKYKSDINQDRVLDFTNQILENDFRMGQIEIDDKWETCYGSLTFDTKKFPNITQLTDYIHSVGGRATLWIHPFVNTDCPFYQQFLDEGRLVRDESGNAKSRWWNGEGAVVDFTNKTTRDWWVQRLKNLQKESGLDGYKFDAGESGWLPQRPEITGEPELYPDFYVRDFVLAAAEFGEDLEVRVGRLTQEVPLFVRMLDKDSRWGLDNGLQSIITTALQMGLNGYPFILPDMIGGNAYGQAPSKELFIRWVQANALLPAMQFSLLPWDYDQETTDISRQYLNLHTNYSDLLLAASDLTIADGRPIVAPVWWYAPEDPETFAIRDQYFTGDTLLVAPVLEEGAIQRDVYLPNGTWVDSRQQIFQGPKWLRNYPAPLNFLPLFTKVN